MSGLGYGAAAVLGGFVLSKYLSSSPKIISKGRLVLITGAAQVRTRTMMSP
jgi:hypothetical protein